MSAQASPARLGPEPLVVIGDSIAEGHSETHGRLHNARGQVDLAKPNEPGQISEK
jgi:hypothetical protein